MVDYLAGLPEVDATRIGASGGATQSFLLAAFDDRITYVASVNMVSAYMQGGSYCENADGLRAGLSNLDIAASIAPRPMLLVSATGDWTSHVPKEEYPAIERIYDLTFNASDDQARVHDVLTALTWLPGNEGADLGALGAARYWTALAVAAAPARGHRLLFDVAALPADDATLEKECFVLSPRQRSGTSRTIRPGLLSAR